jgi:outer membrane lipoprotein-sorting protein
MRRSSPFDALRANMRAACAVAILAAATCCPSAAPLAMAAATPAADGTAQWTLDRLMSTLAHNKSGRASFTETKYLAIADKPIESTGELAFVAPDHLEKVTVSPKPERLVVDGDKLTVDRNQRKYTVSLAHYPELAAFIESIRATLAGNRYVLEQLYKVSVGGHGDDWTLTLTPLDSRMLKTVQTIKLDGTRDVLRTVVIEQADGDHSVMQLRNASRQ